MRPMRLILLPMVLAALVAACSTPSTSSQGGGEPSTAAGTSEGGQPSDGGGGGGTGANGSITYEISGEYTASGEEPFQPLASVFDPSTGGWSATFAASDGGTTIIVLNTQTAGTGQIFSFGDGTATVLGTSDPNTSNDCTFTLDKNDASGLSGHLECTSALVSDNTGAIRSANVSADWDAHP